MSAPSFHPLIIYVDGSSRGNPGPAGIGVAVFSADNLSKPLEEISCYIGIATNNVAEYEAVIHALRWLVKSGKKSCTIKLDSELVYKQVTGQYKVRKAHLVHQVKRVHRLKERLGEISFVLVPRADNKTADRLAQQASSGVKVSKKSFKQRTLLE